MVLYTDGVTEAINAKREEFGLRRLCDAVQELHGRPSQEILDGVVGRLRGHIGAARLLDDISLMVVKQR
jgi:phosphoserine phosphatase RsbU/P